MHIGIQLDPAHFDLVVKHEQIEKGESLSDKLSNLTHAKLGPLSNYLAYHSINVFLSFRLLESDGTQHVLNIIYVW